MAANYRVLVSPVTSPEDFVAELPFSGFNFVDELNGPGSSTVSMPLRPTRPGAVEVINATNLGVGTHCLWLERGGTLVWGGLIWTVSGKRPRTTPADSTAPVRFRFSWAPRFPRSIATRSLDR